MNDEESFPVAGGSKTTGIDNSVNLSPIRPTSSRILKKNQHRRIQKSNWDSEEVFEHFIREF